MATLYGSMEPMEAKDKTKIKYWSCSNTSDTINIGFPYEQLPKDMKIGGKYHKQLHDYEEGLELLTKLRNCKEPEKILKNFEGVWCYDGVDWRDHWQYQHAIRGSSNKEDPRYPSDKCVECTRYKIFHHFWYGEEEK